MAELIPPEDHTLATIQFTYKGIMYTIVADLDTLTHAYPIGEVGGIVRLQGTVVNATMDAVK